MSDLERFGRSHLSEGQVADLQAALRTASVEIERLKRMATELHWMARRYCDGRMSTAPCSFNELVRGLLASGVSLGEPLFARDGMGRPYDGLTDAEAAAAQEDMPKGHAALEAEWMARTESVRADARETALREAEAACDFTAPKGGGARSQGIIAAREMCRAAILALKVREPEKITTIDKDFI